MQKPKLLDEARNVARLKHLSYKTEKSYLHYIREYILFHDKRHPSVMGAAEIRAFLSHLAVNKNVAASTQNIAFSALLFLYREVLKSDMPDISGVERARGPARLPVVFTRGEVQSVLSHLRGPTLLVASLLYGSGLRLSEALRLRVKDVDFELSQLSVRDGKGEKDRVTMLPHALAPALHLHLEKVKLLHEEDRVNGFGEVWLPYALDRKYPKAAGSGPGNTPSRPRKSRSTRATGSRDGTTSHRGQSRKQSERQYAGQVSLSTAAVTRSVTVSPRTCSKSTTISAPFKSCSGTRMCGQRWSTRMSSLKVVTE